MEIPTAHTIAEYSAAAIEIIGIAVILVLSVYAIIYSIIRLFKQPDHHGIFREARHRLARGMLLGLELLVAADIIKTVAMDLTFTSVGVLAAVVLIRSFLSATLELEMTGRWPWQQNKT